MKKLLVVVDYQNDFVNGSLGFEGADLLDEVIAAKVEAYRAENADIMYTMDTHGSGYLETQEGRNLPVIHCQNGTEGWRLYGKTGLACKDAMTISKHTFGSLDLTMLVLHKDYNYDVIEICGVTSNVCVLANAVLLKTAQPEAEIIIDAKAVGSFNKDLHEKTLDILEGMYFKVINR